MVAMLRAIRRRDVLALRLSVVYRPYDFLGLVPVLKGVGVV